MKEIVKFYKEWLGFNKYYEIILSNQELHQTEYNQNKRLLEGIRREQSHSYEEFATQDGDLRIDIPVWFGNFEKSKRRIIVFGLEPRDTNPRFNIERVNNLVFGTPFGIDRWNYSSSIKHKPQNKYFRVFKDISNQADTFLLFSDIVKTYKVVDKNNSNGINDRVARESFDLHATNSRDKLLEEILLIEPSHIITLGKDSYEKVRTILPEFKDKIIGVRHPANGGETQAKYEVNQLLTIV